jgi:hypothetical protein
VDLELIYSKVLWYLSAAEDVEAILGVLARNVLLISGKKNNYVDRRITALNRI